MKTSTEKSVHALTQILDDLFLKHGITPEQLLTAIVQNKSPVIPLSVFSNKLSVLEIVVKYLREEKHLKYSEIAHLLDRDDRTIWTTYNNGLKKLKSLVVQRTDEYIPVSIFSSRKYSVLESLVLYLKELGYSFGKISLLLNKNYQTIYTSYRRGIAKNE